MALNKTEAKALATIGGRSKFSEDTKDKALRYLIANKDKGATLGSTAEEFGMSVQTLSAYRKQQLVDNGLAQAAE